MHILRFIKQNWDADLRSFGWSFGINYYIHDAYYQGVQYEVLLKLFRTTELRSKI